MKKYVNIIGLCITVIYGTLNLIAVIDAQGNMGFIGELALGIDVYTWHIFGFFSIVTLLIRLLFNRDAVDRGEKEKWLDVQSVLHLIFMVISFGGIYYLFGNCF